MNFKLVLKTVEKETMSKFEGQKPILKQICQVITKSQHELLMFIKQGFLQEKNLHQPFKFSTYLPEVSLM